MAPLPDLSIVIVSYQVRELLARCLESLESQPEGPRLEIIVVDNASQDGSADVVRDRFPGVLLIRNDQNRGFSAANNQGLAISTGRNMMLLNPDTERKSKDPDSLATIVEFMDKHTRAGACGPRLVYGDGSLQQSAFRFPGLAQVYLDLFPTNWRLANSRLNGRYATSLYDSGAPFQVDHPLGAAFIVRREVVQQVGLLDERYFIYVEEIDWARRITSEGWEIWCVPAAEIVHHEAQSTKQFRDKMFIELWRARHYYFHKFYSSPYNIMISLIVRLGMVKLARAANDEASAGKITRDELAMRLNAYSTVSEIFGAR